MLNMSTHRLYIYIALYDIDYYKYEIDTYSKIMCIYIYICICVEPTHTDTYRLLCIISYIMQLKMFELCIYKYIYIYHACIS